MAPGLKRVAFKVSGSNAKALGSCQCQHSGSKWVLYICDYTRRGGKCTVFENIRSDIFRITQEEDRQYDANHTRYINSILTEKVNEINHHNTVEFNRLGADHLSRPISEDDVIRYIYPIQKTIHQARIK